VVGAVTQDATSSTPRVWALVDGDEQKSGLVSELAVYSLSEENPDQEIEDCLRKLAQGRADMHKRALRAEIERSEREGHVDRVLALQRELDRLVKMGQGITQPNPTRGAETVPAVGS